MWQKNWKTWVKIGEIGQKFNLIKLTKKNFGQNGKKIKKCQIGQNATKNIK